MRVWLLLDGTEQYLDLGSIPIFAPLELSHVEFTNESVMLWLQDLSLLDYNLSVNCKWSNPNNTSWSTA